MKHETSKSKRLAALRLSRNKAQQKLREAQSRVEELEAVNLMLTMEIDSMEEAERSVA